jgi:ZIP family zinc transporter
MMEYFGSISPVLAALLATLFTWFVTAAGALPVFFTKRVNQRVMDGMLGLAAGVMIAASYWSLLAPAIELSGGSAIPATVGFLAGGLFLWGVDAILPHLHLYAKDDEAEGIKTSWQRSVLLVSAITLHNIPEGLAVAMPLRREGMTRTKAFLYGQASGIVEPIAGVAGAALVLMMRPVLPYALAFAAGAMIFVVVEELVPESQRNGNTHWATNGAMLGFTIMMFLDVALG